MDKDKVYDELTAMFIAYQYRLDHPMPHPGGSFNVMVEKYRNDPFFHSKVDQLSSATMNIFQRNI